MRTLRVGSRLTPASGLGSRLLAGFVVCLFAGLVSGLCTLSAGAQPSDASVPDRGVSAVARFRRVPVPSLEAAETAIRAQLEAARASAVEVLGQPDQTAGARAEAIGRLARLYLLYGFFESAIAAFDAARETTPHDPRWIYYLGAIAHQEHQLDEARDLLQQVLAQQPGDVATRVRLGQIALEQDRIEDATTIFDQLAEQLPDLAAAHHGRAQVAESASDYARAAERYEKVLALQPSATAVHYPLALAYRQLGDLASARTNLRARGAGTLHFPDPLIDSLSQENVGSAPLVVAANKAMSEGDVDAAIAFYRGALERTPDDLRTQLSLANALSRRGDVAASIATYRQALAKAEGGEPVSRYNLGILLLDQADLAGAIESFEEAVKLAPTFTSAHFNLASALEQTGDLARATTHASQAAELAPEDDDTYLLLARLALRQGNAGVAQRWIDTVLARRPSSVEGWLVRGLLAADQRDAPAAESAYRRTLELEADDGQRARAHIGLADLPGANTIDHLETASRLLPQRADILQRLAAGYGREGQMDKAAERYARAVNLAPNDLRAHFGLSTSLMLSGRDAHAVRSLEAALERLSDALPLQHALARLLATSADDAVRDGARALTLAQQVFREAPSIDHAETVAMALAELGRFEEAATLEIQIISQAQANNRQQRIPRLRQRLEQYHRGEPVRDPWRNDGPG